MFVVIVFTVSLIAPEWYTVQQYGTERFATLEACQQEVTQASYQPPQGYDSKLVCSRRWFGKDIR